MRYVDGALHYCDRRRARCAGHPSAPAQITIPAGLPLRIQVDRHYGVRPGTRIEGHLIAPVYSVDHKVLPADTRVSGVIAGTRPAPHMGRVRSFLDGNIVPAGIAAIHFDTLHRPEGMTAKFKTAVVQRDTTAVTMTVNKRRLRMKEMA